MLAGCELSPSKSKSCLRRLFFHSLTQRVFSFAGREFKSECSTKLIIFASIFLAPAFLCHDLGAIKPTHFLDEIGLASLVMIHLVDNNCPIC